MTRLSIRASAGWLGVRGRIDDVLVVCEGGTIAYAGPANQGSDHGGATMVDGFLMPAAADRHVHIGLADPGAVLRGGVTAVRDLAWPADRIFALADLSEMPTFDGPLIRAAGPMLTGPGGYPSAESWAPEGTARSLTGPQDAAAAVNELHAMGAAAIKVSLHAEAGPTPTDAEMAAICDAAREVDLPVTAHLQGRGQVDRALGAGVDELAHAPSTERLPDDTIRMMARRMRIVSTLDIVGPGRSTPALEIALDNLRRFHLGGGTIVYGTDLGNGSVPPGIHGRELRLLRDAGLSLEQTLGALIRAPLRVGAPADLIAVAGDPFDDLAALERVRLVVRAGRVVA